MLALAFTGVLACLGGCGSQPVHPQDTVLAYNTAASSTTRSDGDIGVFLKGGSSAPGSTAGIMSVKDQQNFGSHYSVEHMNARSDYHSYPTGSIEGLMSTKDPQHVGIHALISAYSEQVASECRPGSIEAIMSTKLPPNARPELLNNSACP